MNFLYISNIICLLLSG